MKIIDIDTISDTLPSRMEAYYGEIAEWISGKIPRVSVCPDCVSISAEDRDVTVFVGLDVASDECATDPSAGSWYKSEDDFVGGSNQTLAMALGNIRAELQERYSIDIGPPPEPSTDLIGDLVIAGEWFSEATSTDLDHVRLVVATHPVTTWVVEDKVGTDQVMEPTLQQCVAQYTKGYQDPYRSVKPKFLN